MGVCHASRHAAAAIQRGYLTFDELPARHQRIKEVHSHADKCVFRGPVTSPDGLEVLLIDTLDSAVPFSAPGRGWEWISPDLWPPRNKLLSDGSFAVFVNCVGAATIVVFSDKEITHGSKEELNARRIASTLYIRNG
jgi:hypothetical protein